MVVVGSERKRGCTEREEEEKEEEKGDEGERGTGARSPIIRRKYSPIKPTLTAAKHWDMIMRAWLCMLLAPQVDPPKGPSSAAAAVAAAVAGPRKSSKCRELASETLWTPGRKRGISFVTRFSLELT
ncbi:hypothetical protein M0802_001679 [Mischocyttarus mexicanus]|nr:hypothetical protein M0802_001679 [Mischocyttarus mexicanus]